MKVVRVNDHLHKVLKTESKCIGIPIPRLLDHIVYSYYNSTETKEHTVKMSDEEYIQYKTMKVMLTLRESGKNKKPKN